MAMTVGKNGYRNHCTLLDYINSKPANQATSSFAFLAADAASAV